jgi:hypothetical protein
LESGAIDIYDTAVCNASWTKVHRLPEVLREPYLEDIAEVTTSPDAGCHAHHPTCRGCCVRGYLRDSTVPVRPQRSLPSDGFHCCRVGCQPWWRFISFAPLALVCRSGGAAGEILDHKCKAISNPRI